MQAKTTFTAPILALSVYLLTIISRYIDTSSLEYRDNIYLSVIILQLIIFVLPGIFYCKLRGAGYSLKLNFKLIPPGRIGFSVFMLFALVSGSAALKLAVFYISGGNYSGAFSRYEAFASINMSASVTDALYVITAFAVLPAIAEEFVFRSVMLREYGESGGTLSAVVMSALLFAMSYFSPDKLAIYFFAGVVYALTVYVTQSVFASMAIHILNNIFDLFFEGYLVELIKQPENIALILFVVIAAFLFAVALAFGEAERLFHNDGVSGRPSPDYSPHGGEMLRQLGEAAVSPTFLLCVGAFFIGSLLR